MLRGKIALVGEVIDPLNERITKELARLKEWELSKEKPEVVRQIALSQIKSKQAVVDDQVDHWEAGEVSLHQQMDRIYERLEHLQEAFADKKEKPKPKTKAKIKAKAKDTPTAEVGAETPISKAGSTAEDGAETPISEGKE